jgi:hypothetical protein
MAKGVGWYTLYPQECLKAEVVRVLDELGGAKRCPGCDHAAQCKEIAWALRMML